MFRAGERLGAASWPGWPNGLARPRASSAREWLETVRATRLDAAYAEHPERFPHGPPRAPLPPDAVHINPIVADALSIPTATSDNASSTTSDYDDARASCEPQRPPATCLAALPSPPLSGALAT